MSRTFFKNNENDLVWWVEEDDDDGDEIDGLIEFSFDKKKIYNIFGDYPDKLSKEEKEIFDREHPFWKEFFKA